MCMYFIVYLKFQVMRLIAMLLTIPQTMGIEISLFSQCLLEKAVARTKQKKKKKKKA